MNLLIHPSLPPGLSALLGKNPEWNTASWSEAVSPDADDKEIFSYASQHGWIVVSGDLGWGRIVTASSGHLPSVFQVRSGSSDPDLIGEAVTSTLKEAGSKLREGALITLIVTPEGHSTRTLSTAATKGIEFSRDAFLSPAILACSQFAEPVRQLGQLCIAINRLSVMCARDIKFKRDDPRALLSMLLFSQATTSFEAACILAGNGMEGEARCQTRTCLEAAIYGYAHAAKPELDIIAKLNGKHKNHHTRWLKGIRGNLDLGDAGAPLEERIQRNIDSTNNAPTDTYDLKRLADDAGLADIYEALYRYLSAEGGHPTWDSLTKFAMLDETAGQISGIVIEPRFWNIGETLSLAAQCQLEALRGVQLAFPDRDLDDLVRLYFDQLRYLVVRPAQATTPGAANAQGVEHSAGSAGA